MTIDHESIELEEAVSSEVLTKIDDLTLAAKRGNADPETEGDSFDQEVASMTLVEKLDYLLKYVNHIDKLFNFLGSRLHEVETNTKMNTIIGKRLLQKFPELIPLVDATAQWNDALRYFKVAELDTSYDTFVVTVDETIPGVPPVKVAVTIPTEAQEAVNWDAYLKAPFKCTKCSPGQDQKGCCYHALYCGYAGGLKAPIKGCPIEVDQTLVKALAERNKGLYMN